MKYIPLLMCLLALQAKATNYYFSVNSGNDKNPVNTISSPFRTIDKLNTIWLRPGDSVLFKSGEYFYGSVIGNGGGTYSKPVVYTTYGGAAPAIITGATTIQKWTSVGNGIYRSDSLNVQSDVRNVIMDYKQVEMGRYPNNDPVTGGFLIYERFQNFSTYTVTYSSQCLAYGIDESWIGATLKIKPYVSYLESGKVLNVSNSYITFDNTNMSHQLDKNNCGFFLTNSIKTLDQLGEWYYNPANKCLYMYFGGSGPGSHVVEASALDVLFQPRYSSTVIDNLVMRGANMYGIACNLQGRRDLRVSNTKVLLSGVTGIALNNISKVVIDKTTVSGAGTTGINLGYNVDSPYVTNSDVNNAGMLPSNIWCDSTYQKRMGFGIYSYSCPTKGLYMNNNLITNTAYSGVFFSGSNNYIYSNSITNTCMWLDDGGPIYYGGLAGYTFVNNVIRRNILLNAQGNIQGYPLGGRVIPNSLFMDDNSMNVLVDSNFVMGAGQSCFFAHNCTNCTVKYNTFINAKVGLIMAQDDGMGGKVQLDVRYNDLLVTDTTKLVYCFFGITSLTDNPVDKYGVIDYNRLISSNITTGRIASMYNPSTIPTVKDYTLQKFKDSMPYEHHSTAINTKGKVVKVFYAISDSTVKVPGLWSKPDGTIIRDSIRLKNHTGVVLIQYTPPITQNRRRYNDKIHNSLTLSRYYSSRVRV